MVVWNVVLDWHVSRGLDEYIARRARYDQGLGPRIGIDDVMRPVVARGVSSATRWAAYVAAAGLVATAASTVDRRGAQRAR